MDIVSWYENENEPQGLGFDTVPLPFIKKQRRKRQAINSMPEWKICGADTETIEGCVWLFSTEEGVWEINRFSDLLTILYDRKHARKWKKSKSSKGGVKRGLSSREFFFWNLKFDVQAIMKLMSDRVIDMLLQSEGAENGKGKIVINADTGDILPVIDGRMVQLEYLEGKCFQIKPLNWYTGQYKWGECWWWDISQFYYKIRLQSAATKYLNKSKLEQCFDGTILDASRFDEVGYRAKYMSDILEYAVLDAQLAGELTRKTRRDFMSQQIRFIKPYSMANVAQRALLDTSTIPTINHAIDNPDERTRMRKALTSFHGGWFETVGSGYHNGIKSYDLASAYPYIMYHLKDPSRGAWIQGDSEEEWWEWIDKRQPYELGFAEAAILFKDGLDWYPLVQKSPTGTLVSPRLAQGWFTADELSEARKWPIEAMIIGEWFYHYDAEPVYPFRRFIERFYRIKMECSDDEVAYRVSKISLNSIYGKLIQAVDNKIGKLWNPYHAAMTTGATRARLAELNRVNQFSALSYATDGVVLQGKNHILPDRPLEAPYNLGSWETEMSGDMLILMSGVYSVRDSNADKIKTTFRGSSSYFIRNYHEGGLFSFCDDHKAQSELITMVRKPWSAKQARIKKDYGLINVFEPQQFRLTPMGDSTKRVWGYNCPRTFGDLSTEWWKSIPHSEVEIALTPEVVI